MAKQLSEEQIYEEAKKRVKAKRDFYRNLGTWAAVNILLIIIWALTNYGGNPWFLWPLCIWGVFVLLQGLRVFVLERKSDREAIEKEVEKIKRE
jgi:fatty acid desaturase